MLPKISTPTFSVTVPSLGREVLMRPFLVKEEKILLLAKQSGDKDQIFISLKQVINNCMVDENINISKLPYYDIEYLFIQLRINSIGDEIDVEVVDPETNKKVKATVNLNDVHVSQSDVSNNIKLNDTTALIMKHPTLDEVSKVTSDNEVEAFFDTLKYSIKSVFHDDSSYEFASYSDKDKEEFIDSLSVRDIDSCKDFISAMPSVEVMARWGKDRSLSIKGINSFF